MDHRARRMEEATKILVPEGDAQRGGGCAAAFTDETLHRRLAENASQDAKQCCDLSRRVHDYLDWYAETVREQ